MKRFLSRLLVFAICIAIIDIAVGIVMPRLVANAKGGDNWRNNYICDVTTDDILVFGSSRAIHHYNPSIISDSLSLSCYNCGQNGNGIILNYGRYQLIHQRHKPKAVIYDIQNSFDVEAGDDNHKYLKWLKSYYNRKGIADVFEDVDATERFKMMSALYRYNSSFVQIVSDCIRPMQSMGQNGFRPLYAEMDTMKVSRKPAGEPKPVEYDSLKLRYWDKMFNIASDTKLILVISPTWDGLRPETYKPIEDAAKRYGLPFINFADNPKYLHNPLYFKDGGHLNARGADEFTRDFVAEVKRLKLL